MQSDTWDWQDAQEMLRKNGGQKKPTEAFLALWAYLKCLQSALFKVLRAFNTLILSSP